jgi:hypothetical protein
VTLATAYHGRFYDVWPEDDHEIEDPGEEPSNMLIRPVIQLG